MIRSALFFFVSLAIATAAHASDSLYDSKTAVHLAPEMIQHFGPLSSGIRYDKRMIHAAEIAQARARSHSTARCWHYVKDALVAAHVVSDRPSTAYAKQAGDELMTRYGFKKLHIKDPSKAPVGAVLVYGGRGAGHVEIRTRTGYVSDFFSPRPFTLRPLIGVYVKPS